MKIKVYLFSALLPAGLLFLPACWTKHQINSRHEIKPIEVKPIHITIDVNIKVDRALDDFFSDIDEEDPTIQQSIQQ